MSSNESTSNSSLDSCNCMEETFPKSEQGAHCCNNLDLKNKKSNSLTLLQNIRRGRTLNFTNKRVRKCGRQGKEPSTSTSSGSKNKSNKWVMKFNCAKKDRACTEDSRNMKCCVCTCYRRTDEHHLGAGVVFQQDSEAQCSGEGLSESPVKVEPLPEVKEDEISDNSDTNAVEVPEEVNIVANNSADVYGNLGGANGGASIILGSPLSGMFDISW